MHCTFNSVSLSLHLHRGTVDPLSEGGDSEEEEQKKREKREKEGSIKDKGKIPKRKERFMLLSSFVLSVQDDAVQQIVIMLHLFSTV